MREDAGGVYDPDKGIIHVFEQLAQNDGHFRGNPNPEHTFRHEVGHAIDHYLKNMSQTPAFIRAYEADRAAAGNLSALPANEQHYLSKSKEAFAEAFARILKGRANPGTLKNSVQYLLQDNDVRKLLGLKPRP